MGVFTGPRRRAHAPLLPAKAAHDSFPNSPRPGSRADETGQRIGDVPVPVWAILVAAAFLLLPVSQCAHWPHLLGGDKKPILLVLQYGVHTCVYRWNCSCTRRYLMG